MSKKPKFKPEITRVKLNPEQAVLQCSCYDNNTQWGAAQMSTFWPAMHGGSNCSSGRVHVTWSTSDPDAWIQPCDLADSGPGAYS